jgi:excisionase family DNA binding protein
MLTTNALGKDEVMFTVKQVAEQLSVSVTCVYQMISQGRIACHRIGLGRGAIRVASEDLTAFVESCRREEKPNQIASLPAPAARKRFKHLRLD